MVKICPSCGYQEADNQALYCNKCGRPFPQEPRKVVVTAQASHPAPRAIKRPGQKKIDPAAFLSFDLLITGEYLRLIYILGAVAIILVSFMGIAGLFAEPAAAGANLSITNTTALARDPAGSPLVWIGFLVFASVLWRMFCELFAMLSRTPDVRGHGGEIAPDYETEPAVEAEWAAVPGNDVTTQYTECPKCRKIVPVNELRECEHCGVQGCSTCIRSMGLLKKTLTCRECFEAK
jgi:hypothetical protein